MKPDLTETLFDLLPPGECFDREDDKLMAVLTALAEEFARILTRLEAVVASLPDANKGPLMARWQSITRHPSPGAFLRSCGYYVDGHYVSNTADHLLALCPPGTTLTASPNHLTFTGIRNERTPLRCNTPINKPLNTFARDEATIDALKRTKHAHTLLTVEGTNLFIE